MDMWLFSCLSHVKFMLKSSCDVKKVSEQMYTGTCECGSSAQFQRFCSTVTMTQGGIILNGINILRFFFTAPAAV